MSDAGAVVVGAGHAGVSTAAALRQRGYERPVTLVADHHDAPYQRPLLSKELLHGTVDLTGVGLRPPAFYAAQAITVATGRPAVRIDRDACVVELDGGERLPYAHLVLATGATTRSLEVAGTQLEGVLALRTLTDAKRLRDRLAAARSVVVVGGGAIGMEVAAAAARAGAAVTVLEAADRVMGRMVGRLVAARLVDLHEAHGVSVRLGVAITAFTGGPDGHVRAVETAGGDVLPADLVVVGVGVVPNDGLAAAAGLETADGIVVDAQLRTSDPRVWAAGDCARFPFRGDRLRLESVQNATDQGRTAAASICDDGADHDVVPWFWSVQHGVRIQVAGLAGRADQDVVRGDPASGSFSVFRYAAGRLVAVESFGAPRDHLAVRRLLAEGSSIPPEQARDLGLDLKRLRLLAGTARPEAGGRR